MQPLKADPLRAVVKNGTLVVEESTPLPEGQVFELVPLEIEDTFDDEERAALHRSLERGSADIEAGRTVDAAEFMAKLESRK
jgi:hypothetical protein